MKYSTHFVFGTTLALIVSNYIGSPIELVITASVSSLLPDIDHPQSFIGRRFTSISTYIRNRWGHRTITHSILAVVFVPLILTGMFYLLFWLIDLKASMKILWLGSTIGYLSHLMADLLNPQGIALFYPASAQRFPKYKHKESAISIGSENEKLFRLAFKIIGFLIMAKLLWDLFLF